MSKNLGDPLRAPWDIGFLTQSETLCDCDKGIYAMHKSDCNLGKEYAALVETLFDPYEIDWPIEMLIEPCSVH